VTDAPETHYARSADGTNLAYQVTGDSPLQLVFLQVAAGRSCRHQRRPSQRP